MKVVRGERGRCPMRPAVDVVFGQRAPRPMRCVVDSQRGLRSTQSLANPNRRHGAQAELPQCLQDKTEPPTTKPPHRPHSTATLTQICGAELWPGAHRALQHLQGHLLLVAPRCVGAHGRVPTPRPRALPHFHFQRWEPHRPTRKDRSAPSDHKAPKARRKLRCATAPNLHPTFISMALLPPFPRCERGEESVPPNHALPVTGSQWGGPWGAAISPTLPGALRQRGMHPLVWGTA